MLEYDLKILDEYTERGLLRKAEDKDLVQYNYSEMVNTAPMGELWDEITMFNRGNIYEKKTGRLIARAMPKFLNIGQYSEEKQKEFLTKPFTVTEKMDGCLGILYMYNGEIRCNSRGGFDNYVTDKMKELLHKYCMLKYILRYNTLNVEVISKETHIICNYDHEDLHLITAYSNNPEIGELKPDSLSLMGQVIRMPVVKSYNMTWDDLLRFKNTAGYDKEGFVVRFEDNSRVKVKSDEYLRIAALACKLNKHHIWRLMKNDLEQNTQTLKPYMENVPDELSNTARKWYKEIQDGIDYHKQQAYIEYNKVKDLDKKTIGKTLKDNIYLHAIFAIINGKEDLLDKLFIKMVEPELGRNVGDLDG